MKAIEDLQLTNSQVSKGLLGLLLETEEPSVRCQTLVQLLEKDETAREVRETKQRIGQTGWAASILGEQKEDTYWDNPETCYIPKRATFQNMRRASGSSSS